MAAKVAPVLHLRRSFQDPERAVFPTLGPMFEPLKGSRYLYGSERGSHKDTTGSVPLPCGPMEPSERQALDILLLLLRAAEPSVASANAAAGAAAEEGMLRFIGLRRIGV